MKITHVAEIVNITNVAGILEAEICVAENMRAVLMYNQKNGPFLTFLKSYQNLLSDSKKSTVSTALHHLPYALLLQNMF